MYQGTGQDRPVRQSLDRWAKWVLFLSLSNHRSKSGQLRHRCSSLPIKSTHGWAPFCAVISLHGLFFSLPCTMDPLKGFPPLNPLLLPPPFPGPSYSGVSPNILWTSLPLLLSPPLSFFSPFSRFAYHILLVLRFKSLFLDSSHSFSIHTSLLFCVPGFAFCVYFPAA